MDAAGDTRWTTWTLEPGTWQVVLEVDGETLRKEIDMVPGPDLELLFP